MNRAWRVTVAVVCGLLLISASSIAADVAQMVTELVERYRTEVAKPLDKQSTDAYDQIAAQIDRLQELVDGLVRDERITLGLAGPARERLILLSRDLDAARIRTALREAYDAERAKALDSQSAPVWIKLLERADKVLIDAAIRGEDRSDIAYLRSQIDRALAQKRRGSASERPDLPDDAQAIAIIRAKCTKDWPTDFQMRLHCENRQLEALRKLRAQ